MRPPIGWIWLRAAAHQAFAAPLGEDFVDLRFGLRDRFGGSLLAAGGARHHVRDDRKSENFTDQIEPSPRHLVKISLISVSACATDSAAVCSPRAARAIMFGMIGRAKISPIAAFAGPGQPRLTVHSSAVFSTASLSGGCDP